MTEVLEAAEKSASSIIHDYFEELHKAGQEMVTATSSDLSAQLNVSHGATTGFLSRLVAAGAAEVAHKNGRNYVYHIVPKDVVDVRTNPKRARGSVPGRDGSKKYRAVPEAPEASKPITRDMIADMLLQVADQVLKLPDPLDITQVPTEALIAEIKRRMEK